MVSFNDYRLCLAILNSLVDHIVLIDQQGTIIFTNESWLTFSLENSGDLSKCGVGANYFDSCKETSDAYEGIQAVLSNQMSQFSFEYPCDSPNEKRWFLMQVTPLLLDSELIGATISHSNITERKMMEERLRELATTDTLTSLYNRRYLEKKFKEEIYRANRYQHTLSFIILDIDHFKDINDNYGHLAGDKVLMEVSRIVLETTGEADTCARYGGEEISILLPEADTAEALKIAQQIHTSIQNLDIVFDNQTLNITASMGIVTKSSNFDMQNMIEEADKALYSAKNNGRNMICMAGLTP